MRELAETVGHGVGEARLEDLAGLECEKRRTWVEDNGAIGREDELQDPVSGFLLCNDVACLGDSATRVQQNRSPWARKIVVEDADLDAFVFVRRCRIVFSNEFAIDRRSNPRRHVSPPIGAPC
ncbi:MAG TPA: hypothetical protein VKB09_11570 [Thermomicrobiales bacterium]|nr:hypothetical protein [Thermomicrobiales bacterium]